LFSVLIAFSRRPCSSKQAKASRQLTSAALLVNFVGPKSLQRLQVSVSTTAYLLITKLLCTQLIPKDAPTIARLRSGRGINWTSFPDQGKRHFSLFRKVDITSKAHPASYPMGMGGYIATQT
jgi:hypothetical protein